MACNLQLCRAVEPRSWEVEFMFAKCSITPWASTPRLALASIYDWTLCHVAGASMLRCPYHLNFVRTPVSTCRRGRVTGRGRGRRTTRRRPPLKRRPARSGRKGDPAKAVLASSRARYAVVATRVVCPLQFYVHIQADPSIVIWKTCWGANYHFQLSIFHVVDMAACRSVL
jgi:hypothetical protein